MSGNDTNAKDLTGRITEIENQIMALGNDLRDLQKALPGKTVENYEFETLEGTTSLRSLFGEHKKLLVIHNMGQACRYCTLWGDGLNPFIPHLESTLSVAMLSKDSPGVQRRFANARNWRFRMASHAGGKYMKEQIATGEYENTPGAASYELQGDNIVRLASTPFGPGDQYCAIWHVLGLAGISLQEWTPQYNYWKRPQNMEDGGENLLE